LESRISIYIEATKCQGDDREEETTTIVPLIDLLASLLVEMKEETSMVMMTDSLGTTETLAVHKAEESQRGQTVTAEVESLIQAD